MSYIGNNPKVRSITCEGYADFATADASPKRAGRLVYVQNEERFYLDNGTELSSVAQGVGPNGTGILEGGALTVVDPSTVGVSALKAQIIDITDPSNVVLTSIDFAGGNLTLTNVGTEEATYIGIDASGSLIQKNTAFTPEEVRDNIYLGVAGHALGTLTSVASTQVPILTPANDVYDLARAIGNLNLTGNTIYPEAGTLSINKVTGAVFKFGSNNAVDNKNAHVLITPELLTPSVSEYYLNGSGGITAVAPSTVIDPTIWDDGSGTLQTVNGNNWSVKKVYLGAVTNQLSITLGRAEYNNKNQAIQRYLSEPSLSIAGIEELILVGYIICRGGASDLSNTADAEFIAAGKFGAVSNSSFLDLDGVIKDTRANIDAMSKETGQIFYTTDEGEYYGWDGIDLLLLSGNASVIDYLIAKPIAVSPVGGAVTPMPGTYVASAFDAFPSSLVHTASDWQIATDIAFTNVIHEQLNSPNLETVISDDGVSEIVTVTLDAVMDTGDYELVFGGESITVIPADTITEIQSKLNALTFIDSVVVAGDATTSYTITFGGTQEKKTLPFNITLGTNNAVDIIQAERQQVQLSNFPNFGVYTIEFNGATTVDINHDDDLATITGKLDALSTIGGVGGSVSLTGTPNDYVIEWGGSLNGDDVPDITFPTNTLSYNIIETQTVVLDIDPNVGTYTLDYAGDLATILHDDGIAEIESKLQALPSIASASIAIGVTGTSTNYAVTFDGVDPEADRVELIFANVDASNNVNEVQTISLSGTPTSGSYTLAYNGGVSAAINYNDSLATIESKINAIAQMATDGGVTLSGSTTNMTATFNNFGDFPQITVNSQSLSSSSVLWGGRPFVDIPVSTVAGIFVGINTIGDTNLYNPNSVGSYVVGTVQFFSEFRITIKSGVSWQTGDVFNIQVGRDGGGGPLNILQPQTPDVTTNVPTINPNTQNFDSLGYTISKTIVSGSSDQYISLLDFTGNIYVSRVEHVRGGSVTVSTGTSANGSSTVLTATVTTTQDGASLPTVLAHTNLQNGMQVPIIITAVVTTLGETNGNLDSGTYYWRVKYKADNGGESNYSDGAQFVVV